MWVQLPSRSPEANNSASQESRSNSRVKSTNHKESKMAKRTPWHSILQLVHHNNTECNTGNNIERENLRAGTGGKPLCKECARLA